MNPKLLVCSFLLVIAQCLCAQKNMNPAVDNFTELTDTKPFDSEQVWNSKVKAPGWSWGTTNTRYAKLNVPRGSISKNLTL